MYELSEAALLDTGSAKLSSLASCTYHFALEQKFHCTAWGQPNTYHHCLPGSISTHWRTRKLDPCWTQTLFSSVLCLHVIPLVLTNSTQRCGLQWQLPQTVCVSVSIIILVPGSSDAQERIKWLALCILQPSFYSLWHFGGVHSLKM